MSVLALRDGLGDAVFNNVTKKLDFPAGVPKSRFPQKGLKKGKKILMGRLMHWATAAQDGSNESNDRVICLPCNLPNQNFGIEDFSVLSADTLVFPSVPTNQEVGIAVDVDDTSGLASSGLSSSVCYLPVSLALSSM